MMQHKLQSTVLISMDYCNVLYMPKTSTNKLQLAQNAAARVISGTPRRQHITPIIEQFQWLPINSRCQMKLLLITFKLINKTAPAYICDLFNWYCPRRYLRSMNTTSLVPIKNKTVRFGKTLVDTSSSQFWNILPNDIKKSLPTSTSIRNCLNTICYRKYCSQVFN